MPSSPDIIFDLDGTLIDSAPSILASMQSAFDALALRPIRPLTPDVIGPPLLPTLAALLPLEHRCEVDAVATMFKRHYDDGGCLSTKPYVGIGEMLESLRHMGHRLSIATNKRIRPTRRIVEHLGWTQFFDEVHALDAVTPPRPHKAAMLSQLRGSQGPAPIYVGDRPEDADAATTAGLHFVLVGWGYAPANYLEQHPEKATTPKALIRHARALIHRGALATAPAPGASA